MLYKHFNIPLVKVKHETNAYQSTESTNRKFLAYKRDKMIYIFVLQFSLVYKQKKLHTKY